MEEQGETSGDPARAWRTSPTMTRSLPLTCMACILAITCFVLFPNFSLILGQFLNVSPRGNEDVLAASLTHIEVLALVARASYT